MTQQKLTIMYHMSYNIKKTYPYLLQNNSGNRKVFYAANIEDAKNQAREEFRTRLVYEPFKN